MWFYKKYVIMENIFMLIFNIFKINFRFLYTSVKEE